MTSRFQPPPIMKAAENLWLALEEAVSRFPARKHRYGIGARLNDTAAEVYSLANRAWRDRRQQRYLVERLRWKVDDLKLCMTMAKRLQAFGGKREFFHLALQAEQLGAQVGGWLKTLSPSAQNAQVANGHVQRGQKLSARDASYRGANP
ncbi:four helix bundle protein [Stenotrophomonas sp. MMGLT7]|uniref:four helix bundle protein n=1 Tax=Stenotrophomonas sp. MMGLT7 TaxID=2901227 RepID=UPI001E5FA536|nr:four helix bundle protein [Stenotrophomonas sp. MMGLT7]MCD7096904.1 four helix bundle protein [Stenotrophomonas sp. MMGLT7]